MAAAWEKQLRERVAALGFASLEEFLAKRPGVPYPQLASELGAPVLGMQIADSQVQAARGRGPAAHREAALDALVRSLRQVLTAGWSQTEGADPGVSRDFVNVSAWTLWGAMIASTRPSDEIVRGVWNRLKQDAPVGWIPADDNDEIIRRAFDAAWPAAG